MAAQVSYLKGVRTRYLHVLQKELSDAATLLDLDVEKIDSKDIVKKINVSVEKLQSYATKLESQSDKVVGALVDGDAELLQSIIDEDAKVMCEITDMCAKLKDFSCDITVTVREVKQDRTNVEIQQLLEAQLQMQRELLEKQSSKKQESVRSVKLPKLEIGSFNGDKLRWHEFWDSFETAVHRNETLSEIDKFNYLRNKLTGEARSAIAGLSLSNGNYTVAVKILQERFGDKQEVIDLLYNKLINITPAHDKVESLRRFLDTLNKHLRSLEVLGQDVNQDVFIAMTKSKLPSNVMRQLEMKKGSKEKWSIMRLRDYLTEYVLASERSERTTTSQQRHKDSGAHPAYNIGWRQNKSETRVSAKPTFGAKSSVEALAAGSADKNKSRCRYCSASHWSDECQKYSTVEERKKRIKGSCLRCLKDNHATKECKSKSKVCVYCGGRDVHHRSLCLKKFNKSVTVEEKAVVADEIEEEYQEESVLLTSKENVVMQTARAKVKSGSTHDEKDVRILFDSGSNRTYISEDTAKSLKLKYDGEREIRLLTFGSDRSKVVKTRETTVKLKLKDGSYISMCVSVVPIITGSSERKPVSLYNNARFKEIAKDLILADTIPTRSEKGPIDLLIGNDYYLDIVQSERIVIQPGVYLLNSKLGWIVTGRSCDESLENEDVSMLILSPGNMVGENAAFSEADKSIPRKPCVEDFWNVESIGVKDSDENKTDDDIALENFKDKIQFEDGRYQVVWPWKRDNTELPENRGLALGRLSSLAKKLSDKPDLMEKYDSIIKDQESKGIIEKVEKYEVNRRKHYLPHHAVLTPLKTTTKVRIVYDASAKTRKENLSLNECLCRGPVLLQDLCGILLRFRLHKVGITADIEKAFHQIGLQESERDVTRFLWFNNFNQPYTSEDHIQEWRFKRVPFGVVSSPFLLSATVEHHLDSYQSKNANKVKDDIYMDNVVTGTDSVEEAKELYSEVKVVFSDAQMNLREWSTNSVELRECIEKPDQGNEKEKTSVLGHIWNMNTDKISLKKPTKLDSDEVVTKRTVLTNIASIFDPMGLFGPVTVKGKILMQTLWKKQLDWNEKIDDMSLDEWKAIQKDLKAICECEIGRCVVMSSHDVTFSLLCCCDASSVAYGSAIYLIQENGDERRSDLIFAKSRVAPIKALTIPRLELLAVLVGVRCVKYVESHLKLDIKSVSVLTDSKCVLGWITSTKKQPVFIENRLKEIRSHFMFKFAHVRSENNPADMLSRGCSASELKHSDLWWHGPVHTQDFKGGEKDKVGETEADEVCEDSKQQKDSDDSVQNRASKEGSESGAKVFAATETNDIEVTAPFGIDINRYSELTRVLRVTAWCQRFIDRLRKRPCKSQCLSSAELTKAEHLWNKHIQRGYFADVMFSLPLKKPHNLVKQLGIFVDNEGLLRCHGRLEHSEMSEAARKPILMPNNARYVHLLIESQHKRLMHSGVSQTLSAVRQKFWIIRGRATVRKVLKECLTCRRVEGPPFATPPMAPLPPTRTKISEPFSTTGVDYFGPLYVKDTTEMQKVWVCLYTCGVTRAVHLEIVPDLSTKSFLLCLRRFIAVRGTPSVIVSDNAKQFKLANETLSLVWSNILKSEDVQDYSSKQGIQWKFITEMAPWMGGFYERMVGVVKRALRKTIGKRVLQSDHLNTILKEAEAIVNSHPLTYVDDDINSTQTLTPNHFLCFNRKTGTPQTLDESDPEFTIKTTSADKILEMWKKGEKLTNMFWKAWKDEYLQNLRERHQQNIKSPRVQSEKQPKKGDVVLVKDDLPRGQWKVGKIEDLIVSSDNLVRSAVVRVGHKTVIKRPTNMLFPLEYSPENTADSNQVDSNMTKCEKQPKTKPIRQAAKRAIDKIKEMRM